ncbi:MAG: NAD(P)H-binding protein [Chitinophagaceae bacterium]|nr:NAD(P)H-binding protein [Chitinophagaceae bacterium]
MNESTAVVIGATGMIGSEVVKLLLDDSRYNKIRVIVRSWKGPQHPKLEVLIGAFDNLPVLKQQLGDGEAIFCCMGTTQKQVKGDKKLYRHIDLEIPLAIAEQGVNKGFQQFLLISAIGANKNAGNFYLALKGEVEQLVKQLSFDTIHIFQPSMLIGNRKEKRFGEIIAKHLMTFFSFTMAGKLSRFKAIQATSVAHAMVNAAADKSVGIFTYQYNEIVHLAAKRLR